MWSFLFVLAIEVLSIGFRANKAEGTKPYDAPRIECTGFCSSFDLECNETDGYIVCQNNCNVTLYDCTVCVSAWEMLYCNDTEEVAYRHLKSDCFRTAPGNTKYDKCEHNRGPVVLQDSKRNTIRTIYSCQCHEKLCNKKVKIVRPTSSSTVITSEASTQMFPASTGSTQSLPSTFAPRTSDVPTTVCTQTRSSSVVFVADCLFVLVVVFVYSLVV